MMQLLWSFLKKLKTELPWDVAILRLGTHPRELKVETRTGIRTVMLTAAHSQQPKGESSKGCTAVEYYAALKRKV